MAPEISLALTGLTMGLVGGPHCLAMCTAPCSLVLGGTGVPMTGLGTSARRPDAVRQMVFHAGRIAGYALLGLVVASSMEALGWLTRHAAVLRPVWTLFHVLALVIGLMLLVLARQPLAWDAAARRVWSWARMAQGGVTGAAATGGTSAESARDRALNPMAMGLAWALMPCGLLYSALLVAAVSGQAHRGAIVMLAFALGSTVWLASGPWLLGRLRRIGGDGFGIRAGGAMLVLVSGSALWLGLFHNAAPWCVSPP